MCVFTCGRKFTPRRSHSDCMSEMFLAITALSIMTKVVATDRLAAIPSLLQESDLSTFGEYGNRLREVEISPRSAGS